jgi:hypothetical protein
MSKLPRVVVTDLIPEPLECERRVLHGHAEVVARSTFADSRS